MMQRIETRASMSVVQMGEGRTLSGIAVPYGQLSHVLHDRARPYRERFERGALNHTDGTVLLYGHDMQGVPLASVRGSTLAFTETDAGLAFSATLPESRADITEALQRGDLDGSVSIGFVAREDEWQNRTKPSIRTVRNADLMELSIVMSGAYQNATGVLK
tara:strand:+ start:1373 stop:1855 length:483 start_codon:yes stop_codon:yes gene_type:complete